ncbi:MAG: hypothetical protein JWP27_1645 [Flaviaesturariibacter sp.]|nr:hypothetical protein [Flaviaesturariibacter sp.]
MRKFYLPFVCAVLSACLLFSCKGPAESEREEDEGYDGPAQRDSLEYLKTVDPALNYVPYTRLYDAVNYTQNLKAQLPQARLQQVMAWQERGPIFDSLGPSNGNTRAGVNYTAGRIAAVFQDTLNDPSGNTALVGGIAGGIWRCTNFLSSIPNWQPVSDYMDNLAISSICQNPANPSVMYVSTGEATSNADAVYGKGIWKSTDAGLTWNLLPSSANIIRAFKIACDNAGNVYVAARTTGSPAVNLFGLVRSKDGGATWEDITPTAQGTGTATATCTDIEISNTGKLYASFGYLGSVVKPYVTSDPANVTKTTGWVAGTGVRLSAVAAIRFEMAAVGNTVYGVTVNTAYNTDSCYKSTDGGLTWIKQNTATIPTGIGSSQGWYCQTLAVNPANPNELMCGGLDAYRSTNGGATWQRVTYWVTTAPYVHADHHFIQWTNSNGESRIIIGSDGGVFISRDNGVTFIDKNRNLAIKQFYGGAIHPDAGSPYLIAGAQDNGNHQLKYPGLGPSNEVVGGDGAYVHINQQNPQIQFGAYVYNQYRRSTDGGNTWSSINFSASTGLFINPFDYDDGQNILYGCFGANTMLRWANANTTNGAVSFPVTLLNGAVASAVKMSPNTANRLFLGSSGGRVLQVDNANATPVITNITGNIAGGYVNCVNTGTNDQNLVAVMTNYGVNNVWVTNDGGANWSAIDGNLPDMPVRWALFEPGRNDRLILATEAGIYTTDLVNGASTVWMPNTTFPTVRTDMLKMRTSDSTVVAATHGRGLFTAKIGATVLPQVSFLTSSSATTERTDATSGCRPYADYTINVGLTIAANAATAVTFAASGSAVEGVDYDITTNGSFATPSKTLTFAAGASGSRYITVRIYDDSEVEGIENLNISYSVSGSNATAGLLTTYQLSIADNDRHAMPFVSADFALGTYNTDLAATSPFNGTKLRNRLQVLYTATELRASGLTAAGTINAMNIRVKSKSSTTPFSGFSIAMMNTNAVQLNSAFLGGGTVQQVWTGNYSTVVGNNRFVLSTPFKWDGASNILVQFCYDNTGGTAAALADSVEGMGAPLGAGIRGSIYSNWTVTTTPDAQGCFLPAGLISDNRVNATFSATMGAPIATTLNSTRSEFLGARNDLYYFTPAGEVLARVINLDGSTYGCTQVLLDRAGTGATAFWNSNAANKLMDKTYRIIPTTNSTTGKYEVTFFFTKAEKEGWEAATGQSWNNIQILKVPSRIANVSAANAQPDGPGSVQVISAVTRSSGPDFYTLSAIFENGFSGFGFGVAGRMNTVLTLSAARNGSPVDLTWTTSAEINSSVFQVEKSYDGTTFHAIGTVPGAVNKLTSSSYGFTDRDIVQNNYYRIKMMHTDGYVLYSNIVLITDDNVKQKMFVSPNPFTDHLVIRLTKLTKKPVVMNFYDMGGKQLYRFTQPAGLFEYRIQLPDGLPRGTYLLKVDADDKHLGVNVVRK